ncbi:MAG: hypothetical protein Q7S25_00875, partial [Candidatus Limnocylindria bacterium]|nr:hypothetical protein [Candidatus Limnocylindria bacterium]
WASASTRLQVFRSGTLLATSAGTYPANVYNFIEFKVTINSVTGSYEVRVNGAVDANLSASGVNTRGVGTNNSTNMLRVGGVAGANTLGAYIDDLYICDLSGAANNDYLGDVRVQALLPNAAGAHSQWTPSGGAVANYTMVDEATPNDDTDYNSDATVGDIDTYAFSDLTPTTGTVKAVQTVIDARKDDAGTRTIAPVVREGGVDYVGPNHNVGTTYAFQMDIYETDPATAAAWTVAAVNGDEFGVKVIA